MTQVLLKTNFYIREYLTPKTDQYSSLRLLWAKFWSWVELKVFEFPYHHIFNPIEVYAKEIYKNIYIPDGQENLLIGNASTIKIENIEYVIISFSWNNDFDMWEINVKPQKEIQGFSYCFEIGFGYPQDNDQEYLSQFGWSYKQPKMINGSHYREAFPNKETKLLPEITSGKNTSKIYLEIPK